MAYCQKHYDEVCLAIETGTKRIYELGKLMDEHSSDGICGISIGYMPEPEKHGMLARALNSPESGTCDPWSATWRGHRGTGQTAAMALMSLEESMKGALQQEIEFAESHIKKIEARAELMRKMMAVAVDNQSDER